MAHGKEVRDLPLTHDEWMLRFDEEALASLWSDIQRQGYCVVRGFCSLEETKEIRRFWNHHRMGYARKGYWRRRKDFAMHGAPLWRQLAGRVRLARGDGETPSMKRFECFFWNSPPHEPTMRIALSAHVLRNALSGYPPTAQMFDWEGFATSYRVTRTDAGGPEIKPHEDRIHPDVPFLLQNSLQLSTPHTDYEGGGLILKTREGQDINIPQAEAMEAGDLLLFDQSLQHAVAPVTQSNPHDPLSGFWRLLMPLHPIVDRASAWTPGMLIPPEGLPSHILDARGPSCLNMSGARARPMPEPYGARA